MDELAANVYSCSLDRKCTFMLKTSADLEEMKRVVSSTLDETLSGGFTAQQTAARAFTDPMKLKVCYICSFAAVRWQALRWGNVLFQVGVTCTLTISVNGDT